MASGTIPIFYKLREKGGRKICDGGLLRNMPLRELLIAHRDYWMKVVGGDEDEIPDLDVYIKHASFQKRFNSYRPRWTKGQNKRYNIGR